VVCLFNLEDPRQYALMAEKQVMQYSARKPLTDRVESATQKGYKRIRQLFSVHNGQTAQKIGQDATIMNWRVGRNTTNRDRSEKGKNIYGAQSNSGPASSNAGSGSQVQCFGSGERGHTSYACPQRLMNLIDLEEEDVLPEPTYDNYDDEEEDVDRVMTAQRVEEEDCLPNMSSLW
jgi:hypothetical protein